VSPIRQLVLGTTNPGKQREVAAVLEPLGFDVLLLPNGLEEPEEDGQTFEENARIKALAYSRALGTPCLADDSGLEVDALGGAPGVHSARYAGTVGHRNERDESNNQKLLSELEAIGDGQRQARFVCAMCVAAPDGSILAEARGTFEGVVIREPRGSNGFGYDPLLLIPELGKTSAELSPDEKNARSHRGQATRAIGELLKLLR
jgi:XTP/dITP diphosphohydrolase